MDDERPRALDLFCGAGGMAMGLHNAGFDVYGVDLHPQPNYPFPFLCAEALSMLSDLLNNRNRGATLAFDDGGRSPRWMSLNSFQYIHASCPCQAYGDLQKQSKITYPDLIGPTREYLKMTGLPYTIENVEGAPLINPVWICGASIPGLRVIRHRQFESSVPLVGIPCPDCHPLVFTYDRRKAHYGKLNQDKSFVQVTGGGNCTVANKRAAMDVPWMTGKEANEAIPPAYGGWIGWQIMDHLVREGWTSSMSSAA